ncbi:T9SS type A sorting domain-containing protein [Soonwooa sp.]|uniref:T9SS type A sorting domain-containing protein n=1 Tax=Soonwooa sp. TaxID=1938592 RepID=UPI00260E9CC7|nr:T9SS type A sorting domain-containing protein [Soonwooa sp.]
MKYLYLLLSLFSVSVMAQKAPTYGVTDFNFITLYEEDTYNSDTWLYNILDTGWDVTAFDNNGQFNFKRFPNGGITNLDGCISLDNWDMKYLRIKSNDGSAFKFNSIYLKPDANLLVNFKGYLKGNEVPNASKDFRTNTPERWSKFDFADTPAFENIDEIRITLNVRTHFVGIDEIDISAPILATTEIKKNPISIATLSNDLIITSPFDTAIKIFDSHGKLILSQNIKTGKTSLKMKTLAKGVYFLNYTNQANIYNQKFLIRN